MTKKERLGFDLHILRKARIHGSLVCGWCSYYIDRRVHPRSAKRLCRIGLLQESEGRDLVLTEAGEEFLSTHAGSSK